jgi:hypothetical protein
MEENFSGYGPQSNVIDTIIQAAAAPSNTATVNLMKSRDEFEYSPAPAPGHQTDGKGQTPLERLPSSLHISHNPNNFALTGNNQRYSSEEDDDEFDRKGQSNYQMLNRVDSMKSYSDKMDDGKENDGLNSAKLSFYDKSAIATTTSDTVSDLPKANPNITVSDTSDEFSVIPGTSPSKAKTPSNNLPVPAVSTAPTKSVDPHEDSSLSHKLPSTSATPNREEVEQSLPDEEVRGLPLDQLTRMLNKAFQSIEGLLSNPTTANKSTNLSRSRDLYDIDCLAPNGNKANRKDLIELLKQILPSSTALDSLHNLAEGRIRLLGDLVLYIVEKKAPLFLPKYAPHYLFLSNLITDLISYFSK